VTLEASVAKLGGWVASDSVIICGLFFFLRGGGTHKSLNAQKNGCVSPPNRIRSKPACHFAVHCVVMTQIHKSTSNRFPTIFLIFREQNYFLLPYKKIPHNRFLYFSLYQLNIIFLLLFYSFSLFPTFSLFPISINYTSFILK